MLILNLGCGRICKVWNRDKGISEREELKIIGIGKNESGRKYKSLEDKGNQIKSCPIKLQFVRKEVKCLQIGQTRLSDY